MRLGPSAYLSALVLAATGWGAGGALQVASSGPRNQTLFNEESGLCLDAGTITQNCSNAVVLWNCTNTASQRWTAYNDRSVRPDSNTSMCLDVAGNLYTQQQAAIHTCICDFEGQSSGFPGWIFDGPSIIDAGTYDMNGTDVKCLWAGLWLSLETRLLMNWNCNETASVYGAPLANAPTWQIRDPTDFAVPQAAAQDAHSSSSKLTGGAIGGLVALAVMTLLAVVAVLALAAMLARQRRQNRARPGVMLDKPGSTAMLSGGAGPATPMLGISPFALRNKQAQMEMAAIPSSSPAGNAMPILRPAESDQTASRSLPPSQSGSGLSTGGHPSGGTGDTSGGTSGGSHRRLRPTAAGMTVQGGQPTTSRHTSSPIQSYAQQIHARAFQAGEAPPVISWQIPAHELMILQQDGQPWRLGQGAYGTVLRGKRNGFEDVAVKVFSNVQDPKQHAGILQEVAILRDCRSSFILQFFGAMLDGNDIMLVTEFMAGGDLFSALGRDDPQFAWYRQGRNVALDCAKGLNYLHSNKLVHFDLKSSNVLLSETGSAKIGDVGFAKVLDMTHLSQVSGRGTFAWAAPEVLLGQNCDFKADVYSFGVLLWELMTGDRPKRAQLRPVRAPLEAPEQVVRLFLQCTSGNPADRPTMPEVIAVLESVHHAVPPAGWDQLSRFTSF